MSSTDYVLRVLFARLARAFIVLSARVTAISGGAGTLMNFDTVADMLAENPINIQAFAVCANYYAADENRSLWMRAHYASAANGSDILESTSVPGVFYERIWVAEPL